MSAAELLGAVLWLAVVLGAATVAGVLVRRRAGPDWPAADAAIAVAVVAVAVLSVAATLAGAVGVFDRWGIAVGTMLAAAATGTAVVVAARRAPRAARTAGPDRHDPPIDRLGLVVGAGVTAVAAGLWLRPTARALADGSLDYDTLWYHLPVAARFAEAGSVTTVAYVGNPPTLFYPFGSELLQAVGIVAAGNDLVSPLLNVLWAVLALAAAWAIGRHAGVPALCGAAVAAVLTVPVIVESQAGTAGGDVAGLALLLASFAIALRARAGRLAILVSGAAAGLAVSTKLTYLVPVLALGVACTLLAAGRRGRFAAWWVLGAALTGAFWYLRNAVVAGNPLPWIDLGPLPSLDADPIDCGRTTIAGYPGGLGGIRDDLVPDVTRALGTGGWVLVAACLAGIVAGAVSRRPAARVAAAVAGASGLAYLVTPAAAGGADGSCFAYNTRFALPALALGLVALVLACGGHRRPYAACAALVAALGLLVLRSSGVEAPVALAVAGVVAALLAIAALRWFPRHRWAAVTERRWPRVALAALAALVLVAALGRGAARVDERYADDDLSEVGGPALDRLRTLSGTRIAVAGVYAAYPLMGRDLSNRVVFPSLEEPHGARRDPASEAEWRAALDDADARWLVVSGPAGDRRLAWAARTPGWTEVARSGEAVVYERMPRP